MKTCPGCHSEKEPDAFGKSKISKDGLQCWCTECKKASYLKNKEHISARVKKYQAENRETIAAYQKKWREENRERLKERQKKYLAENKEARAEYGRKHRSENKEACVAQSKKYYAKNKSALLEYQKKYRAENSEKLKKYCRENRAHKLEIHRLWAVNNPEFGRVSRQRRRTLKKKVGSTLTVPQWERAKRHFDNACVYCGARVALTQDHFIPLSKLGEHSHNNILPACHSCNSSKNRKSFFDWYPKQSFYSKKREAKILKFLQYKNRFQQLSLAHG